MPEVLPEGVDRTEESYKREILRLRIVKVLIFYKMMLIKVRKFKVQL